MKLIPTGDGSATIYHEELNETYHSVHGALGESMHVYIENGLKRLSPELTDITILEMGFGTGLNALLTLHNQPVGTRIHYFSIEAYPLSDAELTNYYAAFANLPFSTENLPRMNAARDKEVQIGSDFTFRMLHTTLENFAPEMLKTDRSGSLMADLVLYDAFAPSRQPELWDYSSLKKISDCMKDNALLSTYCAQGNFKRNLRSLGFRIESPPGAFGKREMTCAYKTLTETLN